MRKPKSKVLSLTLGAWLMALASYNSASAQVRYEANIGDTQAKDWSVSSSKISCLLSYNIKDYGRADFTLLSGTKHQLSFEMFPIVEVASNGSMSIISAPPEWRPQGVERNIGEIALFQGFRPFVGSSVSWAMLRELSGGNRILLPYTIDRVTLKETLVPVLSPIGFKAAYDEFNLCSSQLINVGFSDVELIALMFYEKEERLTLNSRDRLNDLISYALLDPAINKIQISAFGSGNEDDLDNIALAKKRADAVAKTMTDAGIDEKLIEINTYGDEQLASTGYTASERQQSSKALVRLFRDPFQVDRRSEVDMPDIGVPEDKM